MAQEAVLAIKKAESEAKHIIENAEKEAHKIVKNAEMSAVQTIDNLKISLKADYESSVQTALDNSNTIKKENLLKTKITAEDLEKKLLNNKKKAIEEVLKKVLEG